MDRFVYNERREVYAGPVFADVPALTLLDTEPEGYNPYDHVPATPQPGDKDKEQL